MNWRSHSPNLVAEDHLDVVGDRAKQDAHQIVSHYLDLAITTRLVQRSQRDVVGASAIGPHGGKSQDLGAGIALRRRCRCITYVS